MAFLDHLKPKIFFVGQPWWPTLSVLLFKISGSAPAYNTKISIFRQKDNSSNQINHIRIICNGYVILTSYHCKSMKSVLSLMIIKTRLPFSILDARRQLDHGIIIRSYYSSMVGRRSIKPLSSVCPPCLSVCLSVRPSVRH